MNHQWTLILTDESLRNKGLFTLSPYKALINYKGKVVLYSGELCKHQHNEIDQS